MRPGSKRLLQAALRQYNNDWAVEDTLEEDYRCDLSQLHPELARCFVQLQPDGETREFLEKSKRSSANICLQLLYGIVHILLGLFLSQTAINGLLEKGKMFVFSGEQLKLLLSPCLPQSQQPLILDIGSGDGHVTDKIKNLFGVSTVNVTETCGVMRRVLRRRGYKVINENSWHQDRLQYDVISCLNVLDRCDKPLSMLRQISKNLHLGGVFIIALVLPYEPFVENRATQSKPSEELPVENGSWESGVSSLWERVLGPLGYTPLAVSRVPYLCEGDISTDYYALEDAIFILRRTI